MSKRQPLENSCCGVCDTGFEYAQIVVSMLILGLLILRVTLMAILHANGIGRAV